jgi:putative SOS response-associated peptidase YedK
MLCDPGCVEHRARIRTRPYRLGFRGEFQHHPHANGCGHSRQRRGDRCIIPALGFYEWHVNPDASEQPYYIHPDDQDVFGFAGIWARSRTDANTVTEYCSIVTLPANPLIAGINNSGRRMPGALMPVARMPAMLTRGQRELWLFGAAESAGMALAAYPGERLTAYPVSDRINSPHNNGETLVEPLETDVD